MRAATPKGLYDGIDRQSVIEPYGLKNRFGNAAQKRIVAPTPKTATSQIAWAMYGIQTLRYRT